MNALQYQLSEVLRPIWKSRAKATGRIAALEKLHFLCELNKKIGIESNDIITFDRLSNEQIEQAITVYENQL